jgi:phosphopantetheinyl transferase (holo-ACP synthase)
MNESAANGGRIERRGIDAAVLGVVQELHSQFVETHHAVHTVYVTSHEREHERSNEAAMTALTLSAQRLREEVVSIRAFYDTVLSERENRYNERHLTAQAAIASALVSSEKAIAAAFDAAKEAVVKSEIAQEKRSDATFVTLGKLQDALATVMPRVETENRFAALSKEVAALTARINRNEGTAGGGDATSSRLIAVIAVVAAIAAVVVAYFHK